MVRIAVGHSEDVEALDAATAALDAALGGLSGAIPRAALVFVGVGVDPRVVLGEITSRLPGVPLIGGTTMAELSRSLGPVDCSVLIALFAGEALAVGAGFGREEHAGTSAAVAVEQAASALNAPAKLCICIANGIHQSLDAVGRTLSARLGPDVLVVGAGSCGEVNAGEMQPQEFFGSEVFERSVTVLLLGGALRVAHAIGLGWKPVGEDHTVTRVIDGQLLVELDGRPAAEVFERYLGRAGGSGVSYVHHPLAVEVAHGTLLRAGVAAGPLPGSYVLAGEISEGAKLRFCEFDRGALASTTHDAAARTLAGWQGSPPTAALVFECLTRWNVLGTSVRRSHESLQQLLSPETVLVGAYVGGELAPFRAGLAAEAHNCSVVTVLLGPS
jgi:hypothetical protein